MSGYLVPAAPLDSQEIIKGSQFITRVRQVDTADAAKTFIRTMKEQFADASHNCWAYIVGNPNSTTLIGCSDDGEPSGTAGKPMLNVLQHSGVGDIVAVCTRYFGGTKLGTGGLARAYGGGVKLALENLRLEEKIDYTSVKIELEYAQLADCEHLLKKYLTRDLKVDYQAIIVVEVSIATEQLTLFSEALKDQFKGQVKLPPIKRTKSHRHI